MLQPHKKQEETIASDARFKVIRAGRKGGKTSLEVESISFLSVVSAKKLRLTKQTFPTGRKVIYIAPTQKQAREIVWTSFRNRLDGIAKFNEQRLEIQVPNEDGATTTIMIGGWENRENYRGLTDVIHITFDEVDTLKQFFLNWQEIFRPMFLDTGGTADFIGTPKKESQNLRRLEKMAEGDQKWACFSFTSFDNPFLSKEELEAIKEEYKDNRDAYRQEILAEHVEEQGALFGFTALVDVFSNTVTKDGNKYLIIDVADDGSDKTIFSFWDGLEEYRREEFERLNSENIIDKTREYAAQERIPFSHIAVDAIAVGSSVASSSLLDGIIGFKSSYGAIKTDDNIIRLPNVGVISGPLVPKVSDYKNLRCQCLFILADHVNNHKIASRVTGKQKEDVIEELSLYQDVSAGDGKRSATKKEDVKESLGRSPDASDTWIMRMYFVIREKITPGHTVESKRVEELLKSQFGRNRESQHMNSSK